MLPEVTQRMPFKRLTILLPLLLAVSTHSAVANPKVHRGPTSPRFAKVHTQQAKSKNLTGISAERATQIQTALVKAGYLTDATGTWDVATQAAMEKFQADNGWQVKLVPDARALIKLGLGPGTELDAMAAAPSQAAQ